MKASLQRSRPGRLQFSIGIGDSGLLFDLARQLRFGQFCYRAKTSWPRMEKSPPVNYRARPDAIAPAVGNKARGGQAQSSGE
jgi:hypothetical protein